MGQFRLFKKINDRLVDWTDVQAHLDLKKKIIKNLIENASFIFKANQQYCKLLKIEYINKLNRFNTHFKKELNQLSSLLS